MDESTFWNNSRAKNTVSGYCRKDKKAELNITIVRASTIQGTLIFQINVNGLNLEGYLKIQRNFAYNVNLMRKEF
jgi:hypothetical protein